MTIVENADLVGLPLSPRQRLVVMTGLTLTAWAVPLGLVYGVLSLF
jgi:hypothetical protein